MCVVTISAAPATVAARTASVIAILAFQAVIAVASRSVSITVLATVFASGALAIATSSGPRRTARRVSD